MSIAVPAQPATAPAVGASTAPVGSHEHTVRRLADAAVLLEAAEAAGSPI